MASTRYDFVIVGGGSAGSALANRLSADPASSRARAGGGPQRLPLGRLHPHAGRPALPDRQPLLRLEVRVGARAAHERPADLPRPRQGARRLEQHQRDDLPARQPAGLRALGAPTRAWQTWDYAHCLPYFNRMENCLAAEPRRPVPRARRPAGAGARARPRTRCSRRSSTRRRAGRLLPRPTTSTATARRASPPFDRNIRHGRRLSAARAYLPPRDEPAQPRRSSPGRSSRGSSSRASGRSAWSTSTAAGPPRRSVRARSILCGGAINSPQLLQLSGVGNAAELGALGIDVVHDLPGVGENLQDHLEVYIQYACTQPVSMQPYLQVAVPAVDRRRSGCSLRKGPGATNHFEGGGFVALQRGRGLPEPDVPLPADRGALRRLRRRRGGDGYQVHVGPMYSDARGSVKITQHATRASTRPCGSTTCPPTRTGASGSRRSGSPATSSTSRRSRRSTPARPRPGPRCRDRRGDPRLGRAATPRPRCTPPARPKMGADDDVRRRPADHARARPRGPAGGGRVGRCRTSPTATSTRR